MDEEYVETVLDAIDDIPAGKVATYGDVADRVAVTLKRGGPRIVGAIMSRQGGATNWWRVVNASGRPAPGYADEALRRLKAERCPLASDGTRVDLAKARWNGEPEQNSDSPETSG